MITRSATAPRLPWDAADPYPFYEQRRHDGDVVWDETAQAWLVLGYHAAQNVLSEPGWTIDLLAGPNAPTGKDSIGPELFGRSMVVSDGAAHVRLRGAVREVFTATFVSGLAEGVDAIAEAVIDHPPTGTVFDFVSEIALPTPLAVMGEWLGLDAPSSKLVGEQAHAIIPILLPLATAEEIRAGVAASVTLVAHFLPLAAARRANPGEDLLSFIVSDPDLLLDEAVVTAVHVAAAGFETIASFLGSAAVRLLSPGEVGARLVDQLDMSDPSLISELLRLDGPAQAIARTATVEHRIGDIEIAPGQQVVIVLAAANRDPAVFDEPGQFRLGRRGPAPLTFGHGPHFCLGAALTRLEAEVALRRVLARNPVLSGPVTWRDSPAIRGPLHLPMTFQR
jgi:cytochrome P450